jgi:hypothetical protein
VATQRRVTRWREVEMRLRVPFALLAISMVAVAAMGSQVSRSTEPNEYPSGVYCTPHGDLYKGVQTPDHPCSCKNMFRQDDDGCCDQRVTNDPVCMQWCHEQHCSCPKTCIAGHPDETEPPQ